MGLLRIASCKCNQAVHPRQSYFVKFRVEDTYRNMILKSTIDVTMSPKSTFLFHSEVFLPLQHQRILFSNHTINAQQFELVEGNLVKKFHRLNGNRKTT